MNINAWVAILFFWWVAGCTTNTDQEKDNRTIFRYNIPEGLPVMDPSLAVTPGDFWAVTQLYNSLFTLDDRFEPVPELAHSYLVDDSGMNIHIRLREAYFHDDPNFPGGEGKRVEALDVQQTFERILDPERVSPYQQFLRKYLGDDPLTIHRSDSFTIHLNRPFSPFIYVLAMPWTGIVPREPAVAYGNTFKNKPVGTGAFFLKSLDVNNGMLLEKNSSYWKKNEYGKPLPYLEVIDVSFKSKWSEILLAFLQKDIDLLFGIDDADIEMLLDDNGKIREDWEGVFLVQKIPDLSATFIRLDLTSTIIKESPLSNYKFRQALNYAIDRERLVNQVLKDLGDPATSGVVHPVLYDSYLIRGYSYDINKARLLLEQSGIDMDSIAPLTLTISRDYLELAEFLKESWSAIGVTLNISIKQTRAELLNAPFSPYTFSPSYSSPSAFLDQFYSLSEDNNMHYTNPDFDSLYRQSLMTVGDLSDRLHAEMEEILLDDSPVIPLYYRDNLRVSQPDVVGIRSNAFLIPSMETVRFSEGIVIPKDIIDINN